MKRKFLVTFVILVIVGLGYYYLIKPVATVSAPKTGTEDFNNDGQVKQTEEIEHQPAENPLINEEEPDKSEATSTIITLGFGQSGSLNNIQITPTELIEDSRCPTDVNCIQAGTVRVRASLSDGQDKLGRTFILGQTQKIFERDITLETVAPIKVSNKQIKTTDYRFDFVIK